MSQYKKYNIYSLNIFQDTMQTKAIDLKFSIAFTRIPFFLKYLGNTEFIDVYRQICQNQVHHFYNNFDPY